MRMRRPSRRRTPTGTPARAIRNAKIKSKPTGTPRPSVTIRDPKTKSKPTGTPRPKRTISQAMKDASKVLPKYVRGQTPPKNVLTETPAPKPRLKRKPIGIPVETPAPKPRLKRKPIGTPRPQKSKQGVVIPKPPTSQQRAAMQKQKKAIMGTPTQQQARRRRLTRTLGATPGQLRTMKMNRQRMASGRGMPKRTTKRTSRRLV